MAEEWSFELEQTLADGMRARLSYELARLHEGLLDDPGKARRHYGAALELQRDHVPSLRGARRLALREGKTDEALVLLQDEARVTSDPRRKAALTLARGRLLEGALARPDDADAAYEAASRIDRSDLCSLEALRHRARIRKDWRELALLLERSANRTTGDSRYRAALTLERARLVEHRLDDVDHAIELYEAALRIEPTTPGALDALERLCHRQGRWQVLVRALEHRVAQTESARERAFLRFRIGQLQASRIGDRDAARATLERAAREAPGDPLLLEELAELLESSGQWGRLVEVLTELASCTRDRYAQLALWHRAGALLDERLARPEAARSAFERALALDPTHVPTLRALSRVYESSASYGALVAMHLAEAEHTTDEARRATSHARAATVLEEKLDDREGAITHHSKALGLLPTHAPSMKALARLYADSARHRALVELHERAVEHCTDTSAAMAHLFEMGSIYEEHLGEPAQAAHVYRRLLDIEAAGDAAETRASADRLRALYALQRATARAGRYEELVAALEEEAALREDEARAADLLERAAEILDQRLGRPDEAVRRYREVLRRAPASRPALAALGRLYQRSGRWEDLLDVYEQELALDPKAGGPALLHKMAELAEERLGDERRAIDYCRRAMEIDRRHRPSAGTLARLLHRRRDWSGLVEVLQRAAAEREGDAAARTLHRLGDALESAGEPERAIAVYERALVSNPGHTPARAALTRLRSVKGAWRQLAEQLEKEAHSAVSESAAAERLCRAGELWEDAVCDVERASACYERAVHLSEDCLMALLGLRRLQRTGAQLDGLEKTNRALASVLVDRAALVSLHMEIARALAAAGRDDDRREVLEAVLETDAQHPGALDALEALALRSGDRSLLVRIDQRFVASAGDAVLASAYQTRLAESLELAADDSALDAYRGALHTDPENLAAARGYARIAARIDVPEALCEASRTEAQLTRSPRRAASLLVVAAQVSHRQLDDPARALVDFERALELDPDNVQAATGLAELLLMRGEPATAADRLTRAASRAQSDERITALWMDVARLQAEAMTDGGAARASIVRVLRRAPEHVGALRLKAVLHEQAKEHEEAAEAWARVIRVTRERHALIEAHLASAWLFEHRLDERTLARTSLEAVLSLEPAHPKALEALVDLLVKAEEWSRAIELNRVRLETLPIAERAPILLMLSRLEERAENIAAAREAACRAVELAGPDGPAAKRHRSLLETREDWLSHAEAMRVYRATVTDAAEARRITLLIAGCLHEQAGSPDRAAEELGAALNLTPDDAELRFAWSVALRQAGRPIASAEELRRLTETHPTEPRLWRELGTSLDVLGDASGRRRALSTVALLGEATPEERRAIADHPPPLLTSGPSRLLRPALERLYGLDEHEATCQLLRHLMPAIAKVYPPDYDTYGLSRSDRLSARSADPHRALAEKIATVFGVGAFDLFIHRARGKGVTVELADPPAIMVPQELIELGDAALVFALARPLADIAVGLFALDRLTPRELEIMLAAVARRVHSNFGSRLTNEEALDDLGKSLYRALPRKARRPLDDLAQRYVESPRATFASLVRRLRHGGHCAALLTTDDILGAATLLKRTHADLATLNGAALVQAPMIADLVRFWVSPEAAEHREAMCAAADAPP